ncbi:unnamed protein product [Heligmosomoides polygyrus]|uniref:Uncharacterized protein n=1 Tax=Heligmosomoides polygyrus TaxID=6339 RepID=A0A3P8DAY8_HELPZ|nr:unnamed protein product [Heligmosomoides polygyrus]
MRIKALKRNITLTYSCPESWKQSKLKSSSSCELVWHLLLAQGIRVVIKKLNDQFQVTSNNSSKAVNVRDIEWDKGILEVLNLAVSQKGYLETSQFVAYGFSVHFFFDHRALGFR